MDKQSLSSLDKAVNTYRDFIKKQNQEPSSTKEAIRVMLKVLYFILKHLQEAQKIKD